LLAVLGFIVVASSAVIASARIAATNGFAMKQHEGSLESTRFMNSIRSACFQWILRNGDTAVAEDGLPYAAIAVLDDEFELSNGPAQIRIFAYDQDTRLPLTPRNWSEFGAELDRVEIDRLDALSISGLDDLGVQTKGGIGVFPRTQAGQALFGVMRSPLHEADRGTSGITLNPRTVPYEVLTVLFGESANELSERLREWRSDRSGRTSTFSPVAELQAGSANGPVTWQTESSAWAFRIDIDVAPTLARSFWAVYAIDNGEWQLETWHIIREGSR
jgi:hypothetical protein